MPLTVADLTAVSVMLLTLGMLSGPITSAISSTLQSGPVAGAIMTAVPLALIISLIAVLFVEPRFVRDLRNRNQGPRARRPVNNQRDRRRSQ